jgi:Double zinc ribbon
MGSLSAEELEGLVVAVLLVVVLAAMGVYMLQRIRRRKTQLEGELSGHPELVGDRAFNRIGMARRESEMLRGQGTDVGDATELIARAQASFDARQFDRAYELAQTAHEHLVVARRTGAPLRATASAPRTDAQPPSTSAPRNDPVGIPLATNVTPPKTTPDPPRIPKNQVESQFQIRLLSQDVERAIGDRPNADATVQGKASLTAAQAAFDRADYTEAFRLALRGRRQVGGSLETLPPPPTSVGTARPAPLASSSGVDDPVQGAELVAAAERCPTCGNPTLADDTFCRGCGTARRSASCPNCGASRRARDTFCGKCGTSFAPTVATGRPAPTR